MDLSHTPYLLCFPIGLTTIPNPPSGRLVPLLFHCFDPLSLKPSLIKLSGEFLRT